MIREAKAYDELRDKIHNIFYEFFERESAYMKKGEFDFEFLENRTDDILRLIRNQNTEDKIALQ